MSKDIKPITQPELTQTNINYSIKIGRQVLKQKLKEEIDRLQKAITNCKDELLDISSDKVKKLRSGMQKRIITSINNDETFGLIKQLYNKLNPEKAVSKVQDLVSTNLSSTQIMLEFIKPNTYTNIKKYRKVLTDRYVEFPVDFILAEFNREYEEYNDLSYNIPIELTSSLLSWMNRQEKILTTMQLYQKDKDEVESKLINLDETLETIEAKLLVQELNKTDTGKDVLNTTESIISDTLNSNIALTNE